MSLPIIITICVLSAILLLVAVLIIRAAMFKPLAGDKKSIERVQVNEMRAAESLGKMISFKTISNSANTPEKEGEFKKFFDHLQSTYPNTFKRLETVKRNGHSVVYRLRGASASCPSVLMSHIDVVPCDNQEWTKPPFCGEVAGGIIWGRGAIDNKATLCGMFEALEDMITSDQLQLKNDLYISLGGDEETGGASMGEVVEEFRREGFAPSFVLDEGGAVVENVFPGLGKKVAMVGVAEKGMANIKLTAIGGGGHASTPPKSNACVNLANMILKLNKKQMKPSISQTTASMLNTLSSHSSFAMKLIFANMWLFKGLVKKMFTSSGGELNAILRTTFAFTMLSAGTAENVLPSEAECIINVRIGLTDTVDSIIKHIESTLEGEDYRLEILLGRNSSNQSQTPSPQFDMLSDIIGEVFEDVVVSPYIMLAASDAKYYSEICPNVFRFSTMELSKRERGMIHNADEQLPVEKMGKTVEFYKRLIARL